MKCRIKKIISKILCDIRSHGKSQRVTLLFLFLNEFTIQNALFIELTDEI